jgi:hypothetical protein
MKYSLLCGERLAALALSASVLSVACADPETHLPGRGEDARRKVVYRNTWGIPHITLW